MLEAGLTADLQGPVDGLCRRRGKALHAVSREEAADMPGNIVTERADKCCDLPQFALVVVQGRDDERRYLDPDPPLFHSPQGLQNGFKMRPAVLSVKLFAEGLEIHICRIQPG